MPTKLKPSDSINRDALKNILEKLTGEYENSYGLYNGKTGLCMCYFLLAETENNPDYKMKARALLDELSENIASVQELDFANGLEE